MNTNPLKQYFRRPALYISLPSNGAYYTPDVIDWPENKQLPVYPMTAIDEITSKTPDAVFNGQAVVDIVQSCVPNIKNAWKINSIDIESILIAIKIASGGETMDVETKCPQCNEESKYGVNLVNLLSEKRFIDYSMPLVINDLKIKFKPLSYVESNKNNLAQYELQKVLVLLDNYEDSENRRNQTKETLEKLNKLMSEIISSTIESISTPETIVTNQDYIMEYLNNCDRQTNNMIRDYSVKLKRDNEIKPLKFKCVSCANEYEQSIILNITDFFA